MKARQWMRLGWAMGCTVAGLVMMDGVVRAESSSDGPSDLDRRWIPSASFYTFGNINQRSAQMAADTKVKQGDTNLNKDGQTLGVPWSIGGTLDIASPVILDVPGKPRLFSHADVGYNYDLEDPVVTRGDPGSPPVLPPGSTSSVAIENVGAAVRAEAKPLVFSGGIGSVFSFEAFDRGFRVRPTLEWMYQRDTMKNVLGGGESEGATSTCAPCRTLFIKSQTEKGFHSLGPGIELEADVGRAGQFLIGFYGSFRAYYLVGDRKANLRSTGSWNRTDNGQPSTRPDTTFITRYEREPWHYRFGMGLRILWSPEE
ncbi:MAG: hypothetical protein U0900_05910 [Myxococcota bacterium]